MQEAGATADLELAYTLADGLEYLRTGLAAGMAVDAFAPRLSFFWAIGMNVFMEVAKLRAARLLWARSSRPSRRRTPKSHRSARTARPRAGASRRRTPGQQRRPHLPRGDRGGARADAVAAHQRARRGARAAHRRSARIARNTQLLLQQESGTTRSIDPWGGSALVERLTHELAQAARKHIAEVEALGGMTKAIEAGIPKLRIEESAARTQARIDSGRQVIVGVNRFHRDDEPALDVLKIDNGAVRAAQCKRLEALRSGRDEARTQAALDALTAGASSGANLLALSVEAARARATVGEMTMALEKVFGRHEARVQMVQGVYRSETMSGTEGQDAIDEVRARTAAFAASTGRRPRILVAKMGQDGHDRGQKVIATAFADLGFDVDVGPLFQTPEESARQAVENDVHVVGLSSLAAGHLTLVPELRDALAKLGRPDIRVVVGGVIPPGDHDALRAAGASAIFGPGTVIARAAGELLALLEADASTGR
jgi:methylmalonyl-CoA mutase